MLKHLQHLNTTIILKFNFGYFSFKWVYNSSLSIISFFKFQFNLFAEKNFAIRLILDKVAQAEEIKVEDQELIDYLAYSAQNYGMDPNDFIKQVANAGQVPLFVAELARRKAVDALVEHAEITDTKGTKVDAKAANA